MLCRIDDISVNRVYSSLVIEEVIVNVIPEGLVIEEVAVNKIQCQGTV